MHLLQVRSRGNRLLVIHKSLVEPPGRVIAENGAENLQRRTIGVRGRGRVIDIDNRLNVSDTAQRN